MKPHLGKIIEAANRFRKPLIALAVVGALLIPLLPRNPFYQDLIIMIFFWATLATAWNLLGGFAGQISLGHAGFFGIGAYTSTILYLTFGLSPWIGMFAGAGIAMLVALIVGAPTFRLTSHFFALATLAFGEVLRLLASFWREMTNGGVGLLIPHQPAFKNFIFEDKTAYAYIILAMLAAVLIVTYIFKRSRFGYSLTALREDPGAAESLGVHTSRAKMYALLVSVFFTSIAGTFYAQYVAFIEPDIVFASHVSIQLALLSIIGGIGTVFGPLVGSLFLTPLDIFLRGWLGGVFSGLNFIVYGVILILAVMYFPLGIAGWIKKGIGRFSKPPELPKESAAAIGKDAKKAARREIGPELMTVDSLSKRFGGLEAVKDLSFTVREGEILGLIGPNGAGKTTVFNLISGFIAPDKGKIVFNGRDITGLKAPHCFCHECIGRTFQLVKPFQSMTVLENIMVGAFACTRHTEEARTEAFAILRRIHLLHHAFTLASSLTIADRKRLELGRALGTKPKLLLLDEVMAGLTPKETEEIIGIIKSISDEGITIIMIEHVMKAVMSLSDRIVVINNGIKLVEGLPNDVVKDQRVVDAYLGGAYHATAGLK
ncbi:MAG: branched-chain amino acid ABC transporter ATP-binding protein/permease [Deltaproteobacteria bacterium]|nr:branched-chain amino acid ABC transporter ATP-binding protein/permease [Deltaproteobacteria bacterium]